MGLSKSDLKILRACLILLLIFSYLLYDDSLLTGWRSDGSNAIGSIFRSSKDVRRKSADSFSWTSTKESEKIFNFDSIFTGENSNVTLTLFDGTQIEIQEKSLVQIRQGKDDSFEMNLKEGFFRVNLAKNQTFKVNMNGETVNLRANQNSQIEIQRDSNGKMTILNKSGEVTSQVGQGAVKKLGTNETLASRDQRPTLIDRGSALPLEQPRFLNTQSQHQFNVVVKSLQEEVSADLPVTWSDHPAYQTFDLEISQGASSRNLMEGYTLSKPEHLFKNLKEGVYTARVRAKTKRQISEWSSAYTFRVAINKELFIPLQTPFFTQNVFEYDASLDPRGPLLEWRDRNNLAEYDLEISRNRSFEGKVEWTTSEKSLRWRNYVPGTIYARVRAKNKFMETPWSRLAELRIRFPKIAIKEIEPLKTQARDLASTPQKMVPLEWTSVPRASTYVVQIAENKDFQNYEERKTNQQSTMITLNKPGQIFTRVLAFDSKGTNLNATSDPRVIQYVLSMPLPDPKILFPRQDQHLFVQDEKRPLFNLEWSPVEGAQMYEVQIATDSDFQKLAQRFQTRRTSYVLRKELPLGRVYWRVKAFAKATRQPSNFVEYQDKSNWSDNETFKFGYGQKDIFE